MCAESENPPPTIESGEWTDELLAEARAAIAREIEADARETRDRQEQVRHTTRPTRERK
jgi:hypothetical protein